MASDVILGDCVEVMATMEAASFDAIVTDPPYGLEFMGKEWDRLGAGVEKFADADYGSVDGNSFGQPGGQHVRYGKSVKTMQAWHEAWATEAYRVAKPGAFLLAFGGTRTYHRLTCALEDAGWEIRDCLVWAYASGFPKSLDVSKAIDKAAGAEREKVAVGNPVKRMIPGADQNRTGDWKRREVEIMEMALAILPIRGQHLTDEWAAEIHSLSAALKAAKREGHAHQAD